VIRRARQIMLRSERCDVRSYSTCAALLADPISRDYPCIVLDVGAHDIDGSGLLRQMRATGWHGNAILLNDHEPADSTTLEAKRHGDRIVERTIGDRSLVAAIAAIIRHNAG
jgi:FixJ family two-component response regulator